MKLRGDACRLRLHMGEEDGDGHARYRLLLSAFSENISDHSVCFLIVISSEHFWFKYLN